MFSTINSTRPRVEETVDALRGVLKGTGIRSNKLDALRDALANADDTFAAWTAVLGELDPALENAQYDCYLVGILVSHPTYLTENQIQKLLDVSAEIAQF